MGVLIRNFESNTFKVPFAHLCPGPFAVSEVCSKSTEMHIIMSMIRKSETYLPSLLSPNNILTYINKTIIQLSHTN